MTLALVIPDITNPYYPPWSEGPDSAETAGYQLVTYNTDGVAAKERALRTRETRADGAVIYDFHLPDDYHLEAGTAWHGRVVAARSVICHRPPSVGVAEGVALMTRYLIGRGYTSLGTIAGSLDSDIGRGRNEAFLAACAAARIDVSPEHIVEADFTYLGGRDAMARLLSSGRPPRAIFAANDLMALGALEVSLAAGLSVPADIAIAGFDDIEASRMVTPALTTVRSRVAGWGKRSAGSSWIAWLATRRARTRRQVTLELAIRDSRDTRSLLHPSGCDTVANGC
jgi:LacI family transcriptional regulator